MFRVVRSLAKTTPKLIGQSKKNTTSLAVGKKVNAQQTKQFSVEKVEVIETIPMSQATIEREGETMKQFFDLYSKHRKLVDLGSPLVTSHLVHPETFVAPSASIIGNVSVNPNSAVWYNAILRGDDKGVSVGFDTNIQDGAVLSDYGSELNVDHDGSVYVGSHTTVGAGSLLRGCTVEDVCYIEPGCVLEEGSYMESGSILTSRSVLKKGSRIGEGELWEGNPATFVRYVTQRENNYIYWYSQYYQWLARAHKDEFVLDNTAYRDAEDLGIELGWKEQ